MSFVREALAVTVLEALCPRAALESGQGFPTNAGRLVFLEKVDPLDDLSFDHRAPVVSIYTGTDDGSANDSAGATFIRAIEVEIVISILMRVEEEGAPVLVVPFTDRGLFSALNSLEGQVRGVLTSGPSGAHFRALRRKVRSIRSEPVRDAEEGTKFAERRLTLVVEVPDDCFVAAPSAAPEGLDRLPQPLRKMAQDLMTAGYAAEIAQALAAGAPVAPVATPLTGVTLDIDISRPADGTPDIVVDVSIEQS